jgi:hypothetical protein
MRDGSYFYWRSRERLTAAYSAKCQRKCQRALESSGRLSAQRNRQPPRRLALVKLRDADTHALSSTAGMARALIAAAMLLACLSAVANADQVDWCYPRATGPEMPCPKAEQCCSIWVSRPASAPVCL